MTKVRWYRVAAAILLISALLAWSHRLKPPEVEPMEQLVIRLYQHNTKRVINIPLEEYLVGVAAAEMPAAFQIEALKAQTIAARTFILQKLPTFGAVELNPSPLHQGADICDLPEHGQAWVDRLTLQQRWGEANFQNNYNRILAAAEATKGMVLSYRGELIKPFYHASCGGLGTESSADVWGKDIPYLTQVSCPEDETEPKVKRQYQFTAPELNKLLGTNLGAYPVFKHARAGSPLEILEQSTTGRIKTLRLGGKRLSGTFVRSQLKLASTRFTMQLAKDGAIQIETTGYGHAVGLCQRGSDALAKQGKDFSEILQHYYPGTELARLKYQSSEKKQS